VLHHGCANDPVSVSVPLTANGRDSSLQMTLRRVGKKVYSCYLRTMGTSHLIRSLSRWDWTRRRGGGLMPCSVHIRPVGGVASTKRDQSADDRLRPLRG
jgi:hypothetical protein